MGSLLHTRHSRHFVSLLMAGILSIFLAACGDDGSKSANKPEEGAEESAEDEEDTPIEDLTIEGVSEKGPFLLGSKVQVYELESGKTLAQTGNSFSGTILSDRGDFRINARMMVSQYVMMEANGYYRNEVTGLNSGAPLTLYALTDLSKRDGGVVNINLLTHLEYHRVFHLVTHDKMKMYAAKKQAESEILKAFHIKNDSINAFEDLSIFETGDGNAALLAISILMQGDLNEAQFSAQLANFAYDIEKDGVWEDSVTATQIADWASKTSNADYYASIRKNITNWNLSATIPKFETAVDKFWWNNYGLGECNKETEGETKKNQNKLSAYGWQYYQCHDSKWLKIYDDDIWTAIADPDVVMSSIDTKIMDPYSVSVNYVFKDTSFTQAFITIWHPLQSESSSNPSPCYGFKYSYKGDAHDFELYSKELGGLWLGNKPIEASESITEKIILWNELSDSWAAANYGVSWTPDQPVSHIIWSVTGAPKMTGSLEIYDFKCLSEQEI